MAKRREAEYAVTTYVETVDAVVHWESKVEKYIVIYTYDPVDAYDNENEGIVFVFDERINIKNPDNPNVRIINSYRIKKKSDQIAILKYLLEYDESNPRTPAWNRTLDSLLKEWGLHNFAYTLRWKRYRTADTDFDKNDEGKGFWDFVSR